MRFRNAAVIGFALALVGLAIACSESEGYVVTSSQAAPTEVAATAAPTQPTAVSVPSPTPEPSPPPTATVEPPQVAVAPAPVSQPAPAPAVQPPPAPPPPPVARGPVTINLVGKNLVYTLTSFSVASGATVTVNLDNQDLAVAHDVGVNLAGVGKSSTCNGPCKASITFTAPAPGRYEFFCSLHADMKGTFTVSP